MKDGKLYIYIDWKGFRETKNEVEMINITYEKLNKTVRTLLAFLLIISVLSITPAKTSGSNLKAISTTIYVNIDGTADYISIQEAINNATEGDTVYVYSGTYKENAVINKRINLTGENKETTVIDGGENEDVVYICVNQVNICNFTIINSGDSYDAGIKFNSFYTVVTKCIIRNNDYGIYLSHSSNNQITDCSILSNDIGILIDCSSNNTITGCNIQSNRDYGVKLFYSSDYNEITDCIISSNDGGILMKSSSNNLIENCSIYLNEYDGIIITGKYHAHSSYNKITHSAICANNRYGVYLMLYSDNNFVYYNDLINNANHASDSDVNYWDNGSKGNYWGDYTSPDIDENGIGDTPYNIYGGDNEDRYPLMSRVTGNILPILTVTLPLENGTLNGTVNISGTALDADGVVQKVEIKIDNGVWETVNGTATWNYLWDTAETGNGLHKISVRAWDGLNYSLTHSVDIYVENEEEKIEENGLNINYLIAVFGIVIGGIMFCMLILKKKKATTSSTEKTPLKKVIKIRCKKCGTIMEIEDKKRPLDVKCPKCGTEGVLR